MSDAFEFGIPGVGLAPGDHICGFYFGATERDDILLPYLRAGLRAGEKCICIVDGREPSVVLDEIGADAGVDVGRALSSDQLEVLASTATYLRSGVFSTKEMLAFWNESMGGAFSGGTYERARAVGEMTWGLRDQPDVSELIAYESELNRFMPKYRQVILCLYDLERFGGGLLVDLLKTHPKLLLGGMVLENPYCLSPDEFLARP